MEDFKLFLEIIVLNEFKEYIVIVTHQLTGFKEGEPVLMKLRKSSTEDHLIDKKGMAFGKIFGDIFIIPSKAAKVLYGIKDENIIKEKK